MEKKAWLDYLYYKINKQRDFELCGLYKDKDGNNRATKWTSYQKAVFPIDFNESWKLKHINQRQILPGEVVLDLETKEGIQLVLDKLEREKLEYYVYDTGSRGVHISVFFDNDLSKEDKEKLIVYFGGDIQKSSLRTMIALEFTEHWKSGKIKEAYGNKD